MTRMASLFQALRYSGPAQGLRKRDQENKVGGNGGEKGRQGLRSFL